MSKLNLLQTPHGWYFRRRVPLSLRHVFGKSEIKRPLHTYRKSEAVKRALFLTVATDELFDRLKDQTVKTLYPSCEIKIAGIEIRPDGTLKIDGLEMDPDRPEDELKLLNNATASLKAMAVPVSGNAVDGKLLSDAITDYCKEQATSGGWTAKTEEEIKHSLDLVVEILGDGPISTVTRQQAVDLRAILLGLPTNRTKDPLYRGKSIAQIRTMPKPAKTLSSVTINKILSRASSLWSWAVQQHYATVNPFTRTNLKSTKSAREGRSSFSSEQLKKLFSSPIYSKGKYRDIYQFYAPLIALHTGMRLNEICQLDVKDVYQTKTGVWVFDVNADGNRKKLKNLTSHRLVPVHPELVKRGFLAYVEAVTQSGATKLFPSLKPTRDGYGHLVSKWFARYRESVGVTGKGFDFHSFRHTVANSLKQSGVSIVVIEDILGHQNASISSNRYSEQYAATIMLDALEKLDFSAELP